MRIWKMALAGIVALGSVFAAEAPASARPTAAPDLISVSSIPPGSGASSAGPCYYYGYGYHPYRHRYYRPYARFHRPFYGFYRPAFYRPYGYHHRRWHRGYRYYNRPFYRVYRPYHWRHHYGYRRHYGHRYHRYY